jgi:parallel beta-helix repeat protein
MNRLFRLVGLGSLLLVLALAVPIQAAPPMQNPVCDYYVDNNASSDGDGSWDHPWKSINDHVGDLFPGDTMCVRGDVSGSGRVYEVGRIYLDSERGAVRDGAPGSPITVRSYADEKVILRNVGSGPIVHFRGADYWVFEGFTMDHNNCGDRAVIFDHGASHNVLRDNEIYDGTNDGIVLYDDHNVGNVIENNHIHHFDAGDKDAHCIFPGPGSDDTIIRGNIVHDCSGDGVQIYAVVSTPISEYSKNVQIVDNVFYRGTLERSEDGLDIKGADGLEVSGNELYGYYHSSPGSGRAIVVQKGSRNIFFGSNVIHDTSYGISCHPKGDKHPENITIENNLFYNVNGDYAIMFNAVYGAIVYHNTVANATGYSIYIAGDGLHGGDIRNNLAYDSGRAEIGSGAPFVNVTVGHNGWFDAESEFTDPTDVVGSGDPGFVDVANNDYHLVADSPACNAGTDVGVTADFEGDARPFGDYPDIGADEHQDSPTLDLTATPDDQAIYLIWAEFEDAALDSYVITYTYGTGGSDASQGPSPIRDIPTTTHVYSLTDVANYVFYTVTVTARDENDVDLIMSNSVRVMPTNFFVYLPLILKEAP